MGDHHHPQGVGCNPLHLEVHAPDRLANPFLIPEAIQGQVVCQHPLKPQGARFLLKGGPALFQDNLLHLSEWGHVGDPHPQHLYIDDHLHLQGVDCDLHPLHLHMGDHHHLQGVGCNPLHLEVHALDRLANPFLIPELNLVIIFSGQDVCRDPLFEVGRDPLFVVGRDPLFEVGHDPLFEVGRDPLFEVGRDPLFVVGRDPLFEVGRDPLFEVGRDPLFVVGRDPLFEVGHDPLFEVGRDPLFEVGRDPLFEVGRDPLFKGGPGPPSGVAHEPRSGEGHHPRFSEGHSPLHPLTLCILDLHQFVAGLHLLRGDEIRELRQFHAVGLLLQLGVGQPSLCVRDPQALKAGLLHHHLYNLLDSSSFSSYICGLFSSNLFSSPNFHFPNSMNHI
ncbi:hypothetical protein HanXRQr2_Chr08g0360931 [Helianthus annuus]|uniref:Uncharacterized protein n=1 Tax=Helianthus annuus TaxID=4232 RepID=A0A9K3IHX2_HELAN|nr:hypothetical protein HanXRQr2_Chr08g0360931 [Helianthus annuus]